MQNKPANIDEHIREYLEMERGDSLAPEQVRAALTELAARKEKYEGYLSRLEETGATQILEADPEATRCF